MDLIFQWCASQSDEIITFEVLDPDIGLHHHAGERIECGGEIYRHRSYRAWNDLAELLGRRLLTPHKNSHYTVLLRMQKLDPSASFHHDDVLDRTEKYGTDSGYAAISKLEEPSFYHAYRHALQRVKIEARQRILDLGINTGDEFAMIETLLGDAFAGVRCVGVDHSASTIAHARMRFGANVRLEVCDINALDTLSLGRFDLLISIGTLQSPGIDYKPLLMHLVQNYLTPDGALILGFPNCRWIDGEMVFGAKAPNYRYSEQSLLYNDVMFCKKYLQQHKFRVTLTGKQYLFVTATRIGRVTETPAL